MSRRTMCVEAPVGPGCDRAPCGGGAGLGYRRSYCGEGERRPNPGMVGAQDRQRGEQLHLLPRCCRGLGGRSEGVPLSHPRWRRDMDEVAMPQSKSSKWHWGSVDQVQFVDKTHGWVLMGGSYKSKGYWYNASRLYRTTDGGATWKRLWTRKESTAEFQFVSASRGWFVQGRDGTGRRTEARNSRTNMPTEPWPARRSSHGSPGSGSWTPRSDGCAVAMWADGPSRYSCERKTVARPGSGRREVSRAASTTCGSSIGARAMRSRRAYKTKNAGKSWRRVKYSSKQG